MGIIPPMRAKVPQDLINPPERVAYRRGWHDRGKVSASKAGSSTTDAKAAAARANGAKGGRPPGSKNRRK